MIAEKMATPKRILDMGWDFARSRVLATGVELDVFTHIADGKHTLEQLAQAASASLRGMEMLLDCLTGLELLTKDKQGRYHLAPDSGEFLVRNKPGYLGSMCKHTSQLNEIWSHLTESVKTGKPYVEADEKETAEGFFPDLVRALFNMNYQAAAYAASYLKDKGKGISKVLDVAAGSSVWGIGIAGQFRACQVTAMDLPAVCNVAREYVENFEMADRFEFVEGDMRTVDFGNERYDLVILGHICHSEGRANARRLLEKSYGALKTKGDLLIADFLPDDDRAAPAIPLLFGLNMLVNTKEGGVYTIGQFKEWLADVGFDNVDILERAPSISPLILATK